MLRSCTIIPIVAIGLAMPAAAQHVSDQDARQAGESVVQAHNKASQAKDAAGVAALYSEDATDITPDGPIFGRAAIQKKYAEDFKSFTAEPAKLDRVIMIGDTARLRIGSWSGVYQSPNGPMHVKGYWTTTDVRDGDTWKIRMETENLTMPPPTLEAAK
jgi:uncharacterized protein (TIGR02246 family)